MARTLARTALPVALALALALLLPSGWAASVYKFQSLESCETAARTEAGWVCGALQHDSSGAPYASFRGVPYGRQPLGELRFQELRPVEPWTDALNATQEGPVCPQKDVFYHNIAQPRGVSEACIYANIHVPLAGLPRMSQKQHVAGLPILVFVHGGGFAFGSGDTDLHGPEYLVSKGVIVVTFNYRLNALGFLSLGTRRVPGNAGLRDIATLLRWVCANAAAFGGDSARVTLAGQSAGAIATHLLTLSPASDLFQRAILLSGNGMSEFISMSPAYTKFVTNMFLEKMGLNPQEDPEELHRQLVDAPLEKIMHANDIVLDILGLLTFTPVVENAFEGITPMLDDEPEALVDRGRGGSIPLLIGFTDSECETFRPRLTEMDIVARVEATPNLVVPARLIYQTTEQIIPLLIKLVHSRYFNSTVDMDNYIRLCTDEYFKYPTLKLFAKRAEAARPTHLYRFSYGGRRSALKLAWNLTYPGAGHVEDLTYIFRPNTVFAPDEQLPEEDREMVDQMTNLITNFVKHGHPVAPDSDEQWTRAWVQSPQYTSLASPYHIHASAPTAWETSTKDFFDRLYAVGTSSG
ncbi:hypothetical protein ACJJTC_005294 [Scirpophaga incertulas]